MTLFPATGAEADGLALAHAQGFSPSWSAADIASLFAGPGVFGFLAAETEPVGMILCRVAAEDAEMLTLAVAPFARRRGVARALVTAAVAAARRAGATAMFLEVAVDNPAAIALYECLGFRRAGLRPGYYDRGLDGQMDAVAMRLDLNLDPA